MSANELNAIILANHNEEHAKNSMVYQVWEDGETTLQKGGELLWQRNLHCIYPGDVRKAISPARMPCQHGTHGFAYTDEKGVKEIRAAMGFSV